MHHRFVAGVVLFIVGLLFPARAHAIEPLNDLTGPWQLFVDDFAVEQRTGLARNYHAFQKHAANPVIRPDSPWEGTVIYMYGNVLPNESRTGYRMWYHSLPKGEGNRLLYAESADGINWTKPNLRHVSYNGSTENNIYWQRDSGDHIASVIHTPWDAPDRQYKLMNFNGGRGGFLGAFSPNGTDFVDDPANPLVTGTGDVGNFVFDFHKDQYLGYVKLNTYVAALRRRCVAITTTPDWHAWPPAYIIIKPDDIDDRWTTQPLNKTDFYGLCGFSYESMYVGFLWVLRVKDYIDVCQDGPIFVELVTSRDGVNWKREEGDRPPLLALGESGKWDDGMLFTAQQPLVENGQIKLYYGGINGEHCQDGWVGGIGLATLRKDGFASLDAKEEVGSLTTRKLANAVGELHVNYTADPGGFVRVEVLDEAGQVIPGYSQADCSPLTADSVDEVVHWGGSTLPAVSPIRLHFVLQNASIYSFRTGEPVTVMQSPSITRQPEIQRVAPLGTALFTVAATGDGPLAFQWHKDGNLLSDGGHYSGTQTATLTVSPAQADDAGAYDCAVSNAGGTTLSAAADLQIGYSILTEVLLPGTTTSSVAGMSADGRAVCGASGSRPVIWNSLEGVRDLGLPADATSAAAASVLVNPDSTLLVTVNATTPTVTKAMRWDGTLAGNGTYTELSPLSGPKYWIARGLGTDGSEVWIVGSAMDAGDGGGRKAVIYRQSTNITSMASLPTGGRDNSDLHCVSDNGFAAGQFQYKSYSPPDGGTRSSFLFTRRRASIVMNSLAGDPSAGYQSVAKCISRDGNVQGGFSYYSGGGSLTKPVIWTDPVTPVAIPFLAGTNSGEVHALNGDGSVAGGKMWNASNPAGSAVAFIWDAKAGTRAAATVLSAGGVNVSGWALQDVTGISADGTRWCGNGLHNGAARGWVFAFADASPIAPLIMRHPSAQAGPLGSSVVFEVDAIGADPLAYTWYRDGVEIQDGERFLGSRTPTLTVSGVTGIVEGEYRCKVTNGLGEVFSNSARLSLLTVRPDLDHDGDVDQTDYGMLQFCFTGPTIPQTDPKCAKALLDQDDDVDRADVDLLLGCFSGPDAVARLDCDRAK